MPPKRKVKNTVANSSSTDAVSTIIPSTLFLGPCSAASSSAFLTANYITHVLSIGATPGTRIQGVVYHRLSLNDSPSATISSTVEAASEIIEAAIKSNKGRGGILVHCSAGVSRSPTVVTAWLMKNKGMSLHEALGIVVRARPQVCPNPGFLEQLKGLERELTGEEVSSLGEELNVLPRRESERLALFADDR